MYNIFIENLPFLTYVKYRCHALSFFKQEQDTRRRMTRFSVPVMEGISSAPQDALRYKISPEIKSIRRLFLKKALLLSVILILHSIALKLGGSCG